MAYNVQTSILEAIDTIVTNRVSQIATDKTVTATIAGCTNALTREYLVSYNGGSMKAYAQEGATYSTNQTVYVLVPEGDFTNQKTIISVAQATEDDSNISFVSSAISNYNLIGRNCFSDKYKLIPGAGLGLRSYKVADYQVLYQHNPDPDIYGENPKFLYLNATELENNIKDAEALLIEASFRTSLPREHKLSKGGSYGITCTLAFEDQDSTDEDGNPKVKYSAYTIDSNTMTGSPFQYDSWNDQYQIFPIDVENFLYVESVLFWSMGFVVQTDPVKSMDRDLGGYGDDIFIKDLEMYGLKKISASNGTYKLSLGQPAGSTFYSVNNTETLSATAKVVNGTTNISDSVMYYWFKEDGRVTSTSSDYQMYAGSGWSYLKSKGNTYNFATIGNENKAYVNKYMCVAVYKEQVVLKDYFTFYNESAKRDITITSSLGTSFSFDRGKPELTCLVNGKSSNFEDGQASPHKDDYFRFVWSKEDIYNQTLTFQETKEELEAQYKELIKKGTSYNILSPLKSKINQLEGVTWNKNTLIYPVNAIDGSATFKCSVYLRDREPVGDEDVTSIEYCIGAATITLNNASVADPTDYYITIENGDQVFQYSESGVSPDDDRYTDPLEVKNLICHFFDPAGLEVNNKTYTVKWVVPLENTMITTPSEGMRLNPANNKIEWCDQQEFPLMIKSDYNYSALNNQVRAIVTYNGVEYYQDSDLLFTKIGENGTNGTDIVAKISPTTTKLKNELLALELYADSPHGFNSGQKITDQVLQFNLYQRNAKLDLGSSTVYWTMSGDNSQSKYMSCAKGVVSWSNENAATRRFRSQIVKSSVTWNSYDYYGFYPLPVINYPSGDKIYSVHIDKTQTLKTITYNADGRNPLYNKNQGVLLNFDNGIDYASKYFLWTAEGGEPTNKQDNPTNAAFKLLHELNGTKDTISGQRIQGLNQIYVLPEDVYDGAYTNNVVHCRIYSSATALNPEVEIYIPIHISLNTYGLKSLNSWDGNHVEINEDENYILAPQIGAGEKNSDNTFTGVVMGTAQTYDQVNNVEKVVHTTGILGYSHGKQSVLIDAETGSATFGLPENQASAQNPYTEGRIQLIPGGESKIGMWRIGSHSLYNIATSGTGKEQYLEPQEPYQDYPVKGAQISIHPEAQGMILNADPAYLSVKGVPLNESNSSIDWTSANTTIKIGDSLEVEVDPTKSSVFSIYRHTYDDNKKRYARKPLVGINQNGQFYTNAVEDGESSMGIGKIGAFGQSAADQRYIGAQFGWKNTNLFKFFVDTQDLSDDAAKKLFLTAGTSAYTDKNGVRRGNEYPRPVGIYGQEVGLYANNSSSVEQTSDHRMTISASDAYLGHGDTNYLNISNSYDDGASKLVLKNNFEFDNPTNKNTTWSTGAFKVNAGKNVELNAASDSSFRVSSGNLTLSTSNEYAMYGKEYRSVTSGNTWTIGDKDTTTSYLQFNKGTDSETILRGQRVSLVSDIGANGPGISLTSNKSAYGIKLAARLIDSNDGGGVTLSLLPQSGGGGTFSIASGSGSIQSCKRDAAVGEKLNINTYVGISPGVATPWLYVSSTINPASSSQTYKYTSILASNDVKSLGGWMYANDFAFNANLSKTVVNQDNGGTKTYNSAQVKSHISWLYDLVDAARSRANSAYSRADSAYSRAETAQTNAYNDAKRYADNNFIKTSRSFTHKHGIEATYIGKGSKIGFVTIDKNTYSVFSSDSFVSYVGSNTNGAL